MPNNQKQLSSSIHHASVALARIPRNSKSSSRTSSSSNSLNNSSSPPPPTTKRDGFHLVPSHPIQYDIDLTLQLKLLDVTYKISTTDKCARIAFNRPEILNAFRPRTIREVSHALTCASEDIRISVILLISEVNPLSSTPAFCAGGDHSAHSGNGGYTDTTEPYGVPRLRVLDLQIQMRRCPKVIISIVQGYAIGGGHILHMVADLTLAEDNAIFGQVGPRVGSFDAGYGSSHMARIIGQKKAREIWFTCKHYNAKEALNMGLINAIFSSKELDGETGRWVRRISSASPTALACTKAAMNADEDGAAGQALLGGHLTRLFYMSEEGKEGREAYKEGRAPDYNSIITSRL